MSNIYLVMGTGTPEQQAETIMTAIDKIAASSAATPAAESAEETVDYNELYPG